MSKRKLSETDDSIKIIVKDQSNRRMFFKMDKNYPIRKILVAFCKRTNIDYRTVTFYLNGYRVRLNNTPMQLKMENNDEIEVMSIVSGGGYA